MKKNDLAYGEIATRDDATAILKCCGIEYWIYDPVSNKGAPGSNAMAELAPCVSWDDFPQALIDRHLIDKCCSAAWLQMHERVRNGEADVSSEILVIEQGVPIWKRVQYHTVFDESGRPVRATGIAENISAYKRLAENYAQAAKQCGVTIWTLDLASKTIYELSNATHMKIFDTYTTIHNVPEVFGQSGSALFPADVPAFYAMFDKVYAGEKTASSVGRWWSDDHERWWWYEISYTTLFDSDGKPVKAIGAAIDISERMRLEERYEEEIKWRKVHNRDVIGSYKMNLTQNICEDGQSDISAIMTFQGNGTVDDFFAREYAAHMDETELAQYRRVFNRENLLRSYREGKTSFTQESYVNFGAGKIFWIKIELDMFLNPRNSDVEAYIYATDIDQKKMAQALVDTVVDMDYDYLALLDALNDTYMIFAKTASSTPLPPLYASNYALEVENYARKF
ncbi:MAG: PAS domain-containing protein, partial [Clostridia bacterium]